MLATKSILADMQGALKGPRTTLLSERSVGIYSDMGSTVREGDLITMTADLVGFDDVDVTLQWQFDNGFTWTDVPGANELTHSFVATPETINYSWRVSVRPVD